MAENVRITFPDGASREYAVGSTALEIAQSISEGLGRNMLAAKVDGEVQDVSRPITNDAAVQLLTWRDEDGKSTFWHSSAHLMAEALEELYPGVKFGIGPAVENGFYYDVDLGEHHISVDDLPAIEIRMKELARKKSAFQRSEVSKADALEYFRKKNDEYKLELIEELEDGTITFYQQGEFVDLCRGPHIPNTDKIKAIKLTKVAGAYWRGDESRKMMTRIYGVTFPKQKELDQHLALIEEAKKRDHRKLGVELELFMFSDRVGAGLPLWLPKGAALRNRLQDFMRKEQLQRGYQEVISPHIGKRELYQISGHWDKYGEDSFRPIQTPREGEQFLLKPMNCPHHCEIYSNRPHSYRELPLRIAEFGTVYRYEQSGELHGLSRVRGFTQDDAHIFCTPEQVKAEFLNVLDLTKHVLSSMGFEEFTAQISLRDPEQKDKYIGNDAHWKSAERAILEACKEAELDTITEIGEAAFYGPKLDFMIKDALGRSWQLGTIQVDYNLPERFELEYIGTDNAAHRPVMIHRAPFGSMERFISILLEHTGGQLPLWLAPEQYVVLPVNSKPEVIAFAVNVQNNLAAHDIRGLVDDRNETVGRKIRDAEIKKIPYMLIVGDQELAEQKIAVRRQGEGDIGKQTVEEFAGLIEAAKPS